MAKDMPGKKNDNLFSLRTFIFSVENLSVEQVVFWSGCCRWNIIFIKLSMICLRKGGMYTRLSCDHLQSAVQILPLIWNQMLLQSHSELQRVG